MKFEITIETPDGREKSFVKDYPTREIASVLTESDLVLCDALFADDYNNRQGRVVSIKEEVA